MEDAIAVHYASRLLFDYGGIMEESATLFRALARAEENGEGKGEMIVYSLGIQRYKVHLFPGIHRRLDDRVGKLPSPVKRNSLLRMSSGYLKFSPVAILFVARISYEFVGEHRYESASLHFLCTCIRRRENERAGSQELRLHKRFHGQTNRETHLAIKHARTNG